MLGYGQYSEKDIREGKSKLDNFSTFLLLSLFVVMSPGVDTKLITKRTISAGKKAGFKMALGITTGSLVHTFAAAFGLLGLD